MMKNPSYLSFILIFSGNENVYREERCGFFEGVSKGASFDD